MDLETYMIVLTDGMSTNRHETKAWAQTVKDNAIHIIAIGVGQEVSQKELQVIASPPDKYSSSYVFSVGSFDALNTLLKNLLDTTCPTCSKTDFSDIIFVIDDDAARVTQDEFQIGLQAASYIVEHIKELGGQHGGRIGFISTNNLSKSLMLNSGFTRDQTLIYLQTLTLVDTCPGDACAEDSSSIYDIVGDFFGVTSGGRVGSEKFLILLSPGRFHFQNADRLKDINIRVLGLWSESDMTRLLSIVKEAGHVYVTPIAMIFHI